MSFLSELLSQRWKLKETETTVTNVDGQRYVEKQLNVQGAHTVVSLPRTFGFVVDLQPDDLPALVVPNLYIGSQDCTAANVLKKYNIQYVLSIGIELPLEDVVYQFVPCLDLPETNIKPVLLLCLPFIHNALKLDKSILVHCNAGVSRTTMVAIAYLMIYRNMPFSDAYKLVKEKRPATQPNSGFTKQLKCLKADDLDIKLT